MRTRRKLRNRGFTLIEVLVVVVIVAIVSSVVLLSLNVVGDDRALDREARRIASLVELAADEAELQGRDFGIEFMRQGYRFVEYDALFGTWTEVVGDDIFRPRTLPEDFELALSVEGQRIELPERAADTGASRRAANADDEDDDDEEDRDDSSVDSYAPHGMIMSSGDVSPLRLTIRRLTDDRETLVRIEPSGEIAVGAADDDLS